MKAGYQWTWQLSSLHSIFPSPSIEVNKHLERLAGLDMDIWFVGRKTSSLKLWSTYCSGRLGIDPITAIPRSLMDLLANSDIYEEQLQSWYPPISTISKQAIWNAYRFAAILRINPSKHTTQKVMEKVKIYWKECQIDESLNKRMVLWPIFIAAINEGERELIDEIFSYFYQSRQNFPHTNPKSIIEEYWKRKDQGITTSPNQIAIEWKIELGIW